MSCVTKDIQVCFVQIITLIIATSRLVWYFAHLYTKFLCYSSQVLQCSKLSIDATIEIIYVTKEHLNIYLEEIITLSVADSTISVVF